ncbi:MAG: thioredoxin family protein [Burkholderiaceae bacterium]
MLSLRGPAAALLLCLPLLAAGQTAVVTTPHMRAELLAHAPQGVGPGKPVWFGLSLQHAPHWHTYWKNAGDSGLPTTVSWQLPAGVQAGEISWPTPKQLKLGPLMNYGYEDTLLLPVPVTVSGDFSASALAVKLRADWLVCREVCIPESGEFMLTLPSATATGVHEAAFAAAQARVPRPAGDAVATGRVEGQALVIAVNGLAAADQGKSFVFFPETGGVIEPAAPIQQAWNGNTWSARVPLSAQRSESPSQMQAVLVAGAATGIQLRMDIKGPWPDGAPASAPSSTNPAPLPAEVSTPLLATLGLALLGGLLLNLMPCVFPVLSLKLLSFAQPGQRRRARVAAGLAYTAGVLVSFVALAALLLVLRAGGEQLGWGFQLQSPLFVAALALLFTLIGLNLAGLFELRGGLPGNLAAARARHPLADHALTGALAVAVASPCTGPFMGVALGSALTLPAAQALLVFATLGLGMALPYLAIALSPGIARHLPRPGAWMQRLKVAMAFPMFATVLWLVWVLGQQVGIDGAVGVLAVLLATALVGWVVGMAGIGGRGRGVGTVLAGVLWVATLAWAWPALRDPAPAASVSSVAAPAAAWQPWSAEAVTRARAQGRPVFVDFTAAWCVTCQYNKRNALADAGVLADFTARNVLLLRADWTRRDAAITQELTRLGRSGVPVYALYGTGTSPPTLLPEILRASALRQGLAAMQTGAPRPALAPV